VICLTLDVHHQSLRTANQEHSDLTEAETTVRVLERLEARGIRATFLVTGRALDDEADALAPLAGHPLVEVGGHTYEGFAPALLHRVSAKLCGSYNGPAWYQRRDIQRTVEAVERFAGAPCRSWRNHMYMHGPYTETLLAEAGVRVCSDGVRAGPARPTRHPSGVWNLPLNVIPDHEHLLHAERDPSWVRRWLTRRAWRDDFGSASYYVGAWADLVLEQLEDHLARGRDAVMLVHPITMYLCDNFRALDRILDLVALHPTSFLRDQVPAPCREEAA
jgi:peptidoglycan/xylan/chitin deacetylase (PgdA/CDA1 family)